MASCIQSKSVSGLGGVGGKAFHKPGGLGGGATLTHTIYWTFLSWHFLYMTKNCFSFLKSFLKSFEHMQKKRIHFLERNTPVGPVDPVERLKWMNECHSHSDNHTQWSLFFPVLDKMNAWGVVSISWSGIHFQEWYPILTSRRGIPQLGRRSCGDLIWNGKTGTGAVNGRAAAREASAWRH